MNFNLIQKGVIALLDLNGPMTYNDIHCALAGDHPELQMTVTGLWAMQHIMRYTHDEKLYYWFPPAAGRILERLSEPRDIVRVLIPLNVYGSVTVETGFRDKTLYIFPQNLKWITPLEAARRLLELTDSEKTPSNS